MALTGRGKDVLRSYSFRNKRKGSLSTRLLITPDVINGVDSTYKTVWNDWFFDAAIPATDSLDPMGMMGFFGI